MTISLDHSDSLCVDAESITFDCIVFFEKSVLFRQSEASKQRHAEMLDREIGSDYVGLVEGPT